MLSLRQRIVDIRQAKQSDGTACTDLVLHAKLVAVRPRLTKPFQGWRYLQAADAPPDLAQASDTIAELPEALRRELAALALL